MVLWVLVAAVTTGMYFVGGYAGGSFLIDNPVHIPESILANVGNVFPSSSPLVGVHEVLGAVLLVASGVVVFRCIQERTTRKRNPLPVCLILFALLFDLSVSVSHLLEGVGPTLAGRYTMANLLIPLALVSFAFARLPTVKTTRPLQVEHRGSRTEARLLLSLVCGLIVAQGAVATVYGLHHANSGKQALLTANRIIVNRSLAPRSKQSCYALAIFRIRANSILRRSPRLRAIISACSLRDLMRSTAPKGCRPMSIVDSRMRCGHRANDPVLVGAVVDPVRVYVSKAPTVANGWRGPP